MGTQLGYEKIAMENEPFIIFIDDEHHDLSMKNMVIICDYPILSIAMPKYQRV